MGVEYLLNIGSAGDSSYPLFRISGAEALPRVGEEVSLSDGELKSKYGELEECVNGNIIPYIVTGVVHYVLIDKKGLDINAGGQYRGQGNGLPVVFARPR